METWKEIWNKKDYENINPKTEYYKLLDLAGYDVMRNWKGGEKVGEKKEKIDFVEDYKKYIKKISEMLNINNNNTIYDVGCACGNFLYYFYEMGCEVGGLDFSNNLIEVARTIMPLGTFEVNEALNLSIVGKYDYVFASGIIHYFESYSYTKDFLLKMLNKANKKIIILDIPDLSKKQESENERKKVYGEREYKIKFKNVKHLYYEKRFFEDFASLKGCDIYIFDQILNNYANKNYRFNCIITK